VAKWSSHDVAVWFKHHAGINPKHTDVVSCLSARAGITGEVLTEENKNAMSRHLGCGDEKVVESVSRAIGNLLAHQGIITVCPP